MNVYEPNNSFKVHVAKFDKLKQVSKSTAVVKGFNILLLPTDRTNRE